MSLAGFTHAQIGYESPSAELLKKIHKKNSFASNLLFIKWAYIYFIRVNGANVIRGMLEETDQDIHESINNLHFLRFALRENYFQHYMSALAVCDSSRYFKELKENSELSRYHNSFDFFMSTNQIKEDDKYSILHYTRSEHNMLWDCFQKIEAYYLSNTFEYSIQLLDDTIFYKEYCNKDEINILQLMPKYKNKRYGCKTLGILYTRLEKYELIKTGDKQIGNVIRLKIEDASTE